MDINNCFHNFKRNRLKKTAKNLSYFIRHKSSSYYYYYYYYYYYHHHHHHHHHLLYPGYLYFNPETNYVPREYSVAAILLLLFVVVISLVSVLNLLYFYISTFRSMCAVPNMAPFLEFLDFMFSWNVAHIFSK